MVIESNIHVQLPLGAQFHSHRKGIHLIIPFSAKWDKAFPLQSTWLSTLCSLFLPNLPSGLYSVSCSVNIICWRGAHRLKSGPFYFPAGGWCDWGKRQQQSLFTSLPPPPATCFLYNTNSLSLPRPHFCEPFST